MFLRFKTLVSSQENLITYLSLVDEKNSTRKFKFILIKKKKLDIHNIFLTLYTNPTRTKNDSIRNSNVIWVVKLWGELRFGEKVRYKKMNYSEQFFVHFDSKKKRFHFWSVTVNFIICNYHNLNTYSLFATYWFTFNNYGLCLLWRFYNVGIFIPREWNTITK